MAATTLISSSDSFLHGRRSSWWVHFGFSSSNPWVLAELQQALQQVVSKRDGLSEENSDNSCDHQDSSGEVVVMRVALPSATQREQVRITLFASTFDDHRADELSYK